MSDRWISSVADPLLTYLCQSPHPSFPNSTWRGFHRAENLYMLIQIIFVIAKTSGGGGRADLQLFCSVLTRYGRRAGLVKGRRQPRRRRLQAAEPGL